VDELTWIGAQASCDLQQVMQADVAPTPLDLTHKGPMEARPISQAFLTDTERIAASLDPLTE
jgi:hypothetical protein